MDTGRQTDKVLASASVAVWSLTPNGKRLGQTLCFHVKQARHFTSENPGEKPSGPARLETFQGLSKTVSKYFHAFDCHVFLFSTGIAVRIIAPLIESKLTDPAVLVIDDQGHHVISLLSGHIGQANTYTRTIAGLLGADPVITTATDVNCLPAIDLIAKEANLWIETPEEIKTINMAFLKGEKIRVRDETGHLRPKIPARFIHPETEMGSGPGVVCTWKTHPVPRETLLLRPRVLALGVGCNRNTSVEKIRLLLDQVMAAASISKKSVAVIGTVDIKRDEQGILELAEHLERPIEFFSSQQLKSVDTIENPSEMVEKHLGVKSVCEAAAILASKNGRLIVPKQKNTDVTLAVAAMAPANCS